LSSTVNDHTSAIQVNAESVDGLESQFTVKIDNNGYVSGLGLASTPREDGTPYSEFIVRADRFAIGSGNVDSIPFIVNTTPTTLNGVTVPAGVYIDQAFIKNGAIDTAKIGTLAVDTANIANGAITDLKVSSLNASKISTGFLSAERIAAGSLDADKITAETITATQIGADAITSKQLAISATDDETANSIFMDSSGAIKIYDQNSTLRVQLGNLSV
jgi:hypothetical protein